MTEVHRINHPDLPVVGSTMFLNVSEDGLIPPPGWTQTGPREFKRVITGDEPADVTFTNQEGTTMGGPLAPPDDIREYAAAMRVWNMAAAEWLGLSTDHVLKLEAHIDSRGEVYDRVMWIADARLEPRTGSTHAPGLSSDGETITHSGAVSLDYDDAKAFTEAIGPKPVAPWETPESLAAFAQLRRHSVATGGTDLGYEQGYRDGESNHAADWQIALDDVLPSGVPITPSAVAHLLGHSTVDAAMRAALSAPEPDDDSTGS